MESELRRIWTGKRQPRDVVVAHLLTCEFWRRSMRQGLTRPERAKALIGAELKAVAAWKPYTRPVLP